MSNKAILCHICSQSHGSLHVYSLVSGPALGSSGGVGGFWPFDTVAPSMRLQTPSAPSVPSPTPPSETPTLSPIVGCKHPPLYLSGSGRASQETVISGFHQQALPSIHNSIQVWWPSFIFKLVSVKSHTKHTTPNLTNLRKNEAGRE